MFYGNLQTNNFTPLNMNIKENPSYLSPQVKIIALSAGHSILDASLTGGGTQNEQMNEASGWGSNFF